MQRTSWFLTGGIAERTRAKGIRRHSLQPALAPEIKATAVAVDVLALADNTSQYDRIVESANFAVILCNDSIDAPEHRKLVAAVGTHARHEDKSCSPSVVIKRLHDLRLGFDLDPFAFL